MVFLIKIHLGCISQVDFFLNEEPSLATPLAFMVRPAQFCLLLGKFNDRLLRNSPDPTIPDCLQLSCVEHSVGGVMANLQQFADFIYCQEVVALVQHV